MTHKRIQMKLRFGVLILLMIVSASAYSQSAKTDLPLASAGDSEINKGEDSSFVDAQRRAFAVSLVMSLADEARSYRDEELRPQVLARAADTLWTADPDAARQLLRRAWQAAEAGDAAGLTISRKDGAPAIVVGLRRISGHDLRSAVLTVAARRDRSLADEFLNKLTEDSKREAEDAGSKSRQPADSWIVSDAVAKRLHVAEKLLEDGQVERALEIARPALTDVNQKSISFLSTVRQRRPEFADETYLMLLRRAEFDPASDANTASGLSSYVFTPGYYVTFSPEGGARWTPSDNPLPPANMPPAVRDQFLRVAASILLRPSPPPDQDFTSSGRTGKSMIIKRLLPLFDLYAPDAAAGLRAQLSALADNTSKNWFREDSSFVARHIQKDETGADALDKLQDRIDRAKTSQERDWIYAEAACALSHQGDRRAPDIADKISDSERRERLRRFVDFDLVRFAIRQKKDSEVVRLTKTGQLTHVQKAWAYAQAALLVVESEPSRSQDLLTEAIDQTRRIDADDPDRPRMLTAVANQIFVADRIRSWEVMSEAVNSANAAEKFSGESSEVYFAIATKGGMRTASIGGKEFGVAPVFQALASDDLHRSVDLAKRFKQDSPRANAILAIAGSILKKP